MNLPVIPGDKANHVVYGAVIGAAFTLAATPYLGSQTWAWSMVAVCAAAVLKEARDLYANYQARKAGRVPPHSVEALDAVATAVGGLLVNINLI